MNNVLSIVSWNVNSIRARLAAVQRFITERSPDILMLQELKCTESTFPYTELEYYGYNIALCGQKTYNGVAILSKTPLEDIKYDLNSDAPNPCTLEARYIEAFTVHGAYALRLCCVYVPQGQSVSSERFLHKLDYMRLIRKKAAQLNKDNSEIVVLGGDFNIAPEAIDVHDPEALDGEVGFHPNERVEFEMLLQGGFIDSLRTIHPTHTNMYSWWDYRRHGYHRNAGMRLDHIIVSNHALDSIESAGIYSTVRGWDKPSDHAPVFCNFTLRHRI